MTTLHEYIKRTGPFREENKETKLFISTRKPHKHVTTGTLARWMKECLRLAGIDTSVFKAHSFRRASVSSAYAHGATLHDIMSAANWSSVSTFREFYNRPVGENSFHSAVLSSVK